MNEMIGKIKDVHPCIADMATLKETVWINPDKIPESEAEAASVLGMKDILDAERRLERFAPYLAEVFPETAPEGGIIESEVRAVSKMKRRLEETYGISIPGELMVKLDSHLKISGSIKARGGIYEVLKTAEDIAIENGFLKETDDYRKLNIDEARAMFGRYSMGVGSTGNLGLSIGIMSAKLGFRVQVHMSADARQWKKDLLRSKGVEVIEYESDYSVAIKTGREMAKSDPFCHFVDDENSTTLFLGYAVAALRLKRQFDEAGITVDKDHPLLVWLPCGVGGAPGGVAFGIKTVFGDAAHCFFAEPTHSCCMTLGFATGLHNEISVQDLGLDNRTAADGLAVGRASGFVGKFIMPFISGSYTLDDDRMFVMLADLAETEDIRLEPSALAGMYGPVLTAKDERFSEYLKKEGIAGSVKNGIQLVWATGGNMVPENEIEGYIARGTELRD